jgi:CBS domain-containing protein
MNTVRRLIDTQNGKLAVVNPNNSAQEGLQIMADRDIGALLVIDQGAMVGIVTERDFVRRLLNIGHDPQAVRIRDIMTTNVLYVHPETSVEHCMALMTEKQVRHLPVVDQKANLVGIISIRDIIADVISEKEFIIEQLEHYILDRRPHLPSVG